MYVCIYIYIYIYITPRQKDIVSAKFFIGKIDRFDIYIYIYIYIYRYIYIDTDIDAYIPVYL